MSSVTRVPETSPRADDLEADDALETLRGYTKRRLVKDAFTRFRYGDGFSSARALAFQLVLTIIPFFIALVGLSSLLQRSSAATVIRQTLLRLTPGTSDKVLDQALQHGQAVSGRTGGIAALVSGLVVAIIAMTTAMGQIERGSNRIYGVQRDRPALRKYGRALVMGGTAGLLSLAAFTLLVAGGSFARSMSTVVHWGSGAALAFDVARWPVGILLAVAAFTIVFRRAPRRCQPAMSWLSFGALLSVLLWLVFTALLALYIESSGTFGSVYGPLTGVMALLLWGLLTSIALFLGLALAAQLEAVRAGVHAPALPDMEEEERPEAWPPVPPAVRVHS